MQYLNIFVPWGTLANSEDPDEMQQNAASHQRLHCLQRLKHSSGTEIHHNLENSTRDPLKYTKDCPILTVSICMGKSISIQRVNIKSNLQIRACEKNQVFGTVGAQWLTGRVLDLRPRGHRFEPHRCHSVVSLSKTH